MQSATSENTSLFSKFIAVMCAVVMAISLMPAPSYAADDVQLTAGEQPSLSLPVTSKVQVGIYEPGEYRVDASFFLYSSLNPVAPLNAHMTNPNNPFGAKPETDNMLPGTIVPDELVPNRPVRNNATLVVGEDDSLTLTVPILNPVFILTNIELGTNDGAEVVDFTTRDGKYPANDNPKFTKRVNSVTFKLTDNKPLDLNGDPIGIDGYWIEGCSQYASSVVEIAAPFSIKMILGVNFDMVPTKTIHANNPLVAPDLVYNGGEQNGVTFEESKVDVVSGDYKAKDAGKYSVTLKPKAPATWLDGTSDERTFEWSIAKAELVKSYSKVMKLTDYENSYEALSLDLPTAEEVNSNFVFKGFVGEDNENNVDGLKTRTFESWNTSIGSWNDLSFGDWSVGVDGMELSAFSPKGYPGELAGNDVSTKNYHVTTKATVYVAMHPDQMPVAKDVVYNGKPQVGLTHADGTPMRTNPEYDADVDANVATPWVDQTMDGFLFQEFVNVGEYTSELVPSINWLNDDGYWADGTNGILPVTWHITPATLTVQPKDAYIYEGDVPTFDQISVTGFVEGENVANASGYIAPTAGLPDGLSSEDLKAGQTYDIVATGGSADNYAFEYIPGTLTVLDRGVAAVPQTLGDFVYNGKNQQSVLGGPGYTLTNAKAKDAGTYVTTATLNEDCTKWADGSTEPTKSFEWTIAKAPLVASYVEEAVSRADMEAGVDWPMFKIAYDGFVNGESPQLGNVKDFVAPVLYEHANGEITIKAEDWKPGYFVNYGFVPVGGSAANYEFTYVRGELWCIQDSADRHSTSASLPMVEQGLIYNGSEQIGVIARPGSILLENGSALNAGTHVAKLTLDDAFNKWFVNDKYWHAENATPAATDRLISAQWSIAQAPLNVKAADITIAAGETPEFAVEYTGFLGKDNETNADGFEAPVVSLPEGITIADLKPGKTYELTISGGKSTNYFMNEYTNGTLTVLSEEIADFKFEALTYNGKDQVILEETDAYEVSGDVSAKVPGEYEVKVTLKEGYVWADGTEEAAKTFPWTIQKATLTASYAGETIVVGEKPELKVEISGFVEGENTDNAAEFVAPVLKNENTKVGEYELLPEGGEAAYYDFVYAPGVLKIVKEEPVPPVDPEQPEGTDPDQPSNPNSDDESTTAPEANKPGTDSQNNAGGLAQTNDMAKTFGAGAAVVAALAGGVAIFARRRMMD